MVARVERVIAVLRRVVVGSGRGPIRLEELLDVTGQTIDAVAARPGRPGRLGEDDSALRNTACVWAARLAGVQSASMPRAVIAARISGSIVAAWPKMLSAQASRIAGCEA